MFIILISPVRKYASTWQRRGYLKKKERRKKGRFVESRMFENFTGQNYNVRNYVKAREKLNIRYGFLKNTISDKVTF